MTTTSLPLPQDSADILTDVEFFFDSLPAKRRGRRTRAEIDAPYDITPECENYGPEAEPSVTIELDADALKRLPALLRALGLARSDKAARVTILEILDLLGLELEGGK